MGGSRSGRRRYPAAVDLAATLALYARALPGGFGMPSSTTPRTRAAGGGRRPRSRYGDDARAFNRPDGQPAREYGVARGSEGRGGDASRADRRRALQRHGAGGSGHPRHDRRRAGHGGPSKCHPDGIARPMEIPVLRGGEDVSDLTPVDETVQGSGPNNQEAEDKFAPDPLASTDLSIV